MESKTYRNGIGIIATATNPMRLLAQFIPSLWNTEGALVTAQQLSDKLGWTAYWALRIEGMHQRIRYVGTYLLQLRWPNTSKMCRSDN